MPADLSDRLATLVVAGIALLIAGAVVAYRKVGEVFCSNAGQVDWLSGGAPRIYDNSCLFLVFVPTVKDATTSCAALSAALRAGGGTTCKTK